MGEYITLLGAEQVQSAANTMRSAADNMRDAAFNFQGVVEQFNRHLDRLEGILNDHAERIERAMNTSRPNTGPR